MKAVKKRVISYLLIIVMLVGLFPGFVFVREAKAATSSVALDNLGEYGSIRIGSKTKSGNWWKMEIGDDTAFCMNLGYTCHTGDAYQSASATYNNSDSGKKGKKAYIGYWFDKTQGQSNKAFIMAQALFWAVEEGQTSEAELKAVISKIKSNTGYYSSKSAGELYTDIFEKSGSFSVKVTEWKYSGSGSHRQELLVVEASVKPVKPKRACGKESYRQKITMNKKDEEGNPVAGVKFSVEARNLDDLYQYKINDTGTGDVDEDINNFTLEQTTDANGQFSIRYVYQLQTGYYYYLDSDELEDMSAEDKKKKKEEWDDKGWRYGNDLSFDGAYTKYTAELEKMKDKIHNSYIIKEIDTASANLVADPEYAKGVTLTLDRDDSTMEWTGGELPDIKSHPVEVINKYKKATVEVVKVDSYSGDHKAHGDASLEGAEFQLYNDAACTQKATVYGDDGKKKTAGIYTVRNGSFETDYLRSDVTYHLKEVKAPEGYKLNKKDYTVRVGGDKLDPVEYTKKAVQIEVDNEPIRGKFALQKFYSDGKTGELHPEVGAVFQVYLKDKGGENKGTYDNCDEYERDIITIDEKGYACTKELYYGKYVIHQVSSGDKDTEKIKDIENAEIKDPDRSEPYYFNMNNNLFKAYLRIIKKDGNTKKDVLKAGTAYQIYQVAGGKENLVTQEYSNGNKKVTVDRFVTDETGQIMTYQALPSGKYRIYEVDAATGYHISTPYIEVEISSGADNYKTETDKDGNTYSTVELEYVNHEAYGRLSLNKTGEQLADFKDGQFVYEEKQLKGVTFEIFADDDIETQDGQGTCWFNKDDLVGTIITGEGAAFTSGCGGLTGYETDSEGIVTVNLPLGKYRIEEKKTLYGYVLLEKDWKVEFNWENKDTEAVLNSTDATDEAGILNVKNQRAKAAVRLKKKDAESSEVVSGALFGIYTRDDIYNADGEKIAEADTRLGTMETDQEGKAVSPLDLPLMSEGYERDPEEETASGGAISGSGNTKEGGEASPLNSGDYYIQELAVSGSYYLDPEKIPLHLEYQDEKTAVIQADTVKENRQTGVEVSKQSLTGSGEILGCDLQITDGKGNVIVSWRSGDSGSVWLSGQAEAMGYQNLKATVLTEGAGREGRLVIRGLLHDEEYLLTETRPADGYVTADSIRFRLQETEQGTTAAAIQNSAGEYERREDSLVIMYDDTTKVEISKTDIAGSEEIPGCELAITEKDSGKIVESWRSGKEKHRIVQKLAVGKTYILTETRPADGYTTADSIEFTIQDTGAVQGVHMKDDTIKLRFVKKNEAGDRIGGARIRVYDSRGKRVAAFTTKKGKTVKLDGILKAGETYIFREVKAPAGYEKAEPVRYKIRDTGKRQTVTMVDKKLGTIRTETPGDFHEGSGSGTSPQTGFMELLAGLFTMALAGGGGSLLAWRRYFAGLR